MSKIKVFFKNIIIKTIKIIKYFPWYGYLFTAISLISMVLFYYIGRAITANIYGPSKCIVPSINIDNNIPLIPYFFIQIYVLCYPIWFFLPLLTSKYLKRSDLINAFIVFEFSFVIAIIFLTYPTLMDRSKDAYLSDLINNPDKYHGFSYWLLKLVIALDGKQYNYSPLPSVHCMTMICLYLPTFNKKEIPLWIKISSLIFTVLCLCSTLFTKQHYFMDMVLGTLIPIIIFVMIHFINPGKAIYQKVNERRQSNLNKTSI